MPISILQAAAGLAMLYFGGEWLIRGASMLAQRSGVSQLAIGLTVVAFGTSTPELVVSMDAALSGADDISVGNVVGSNIANVALILGLSAVLRPAAIEAKMVRVDAPLMIVASIALAAVMADGQASRWEGLFLLLGLFSYTVLTFWEARRESDRVKGELASVAPVAARGPAASALLITVGLLLLLVGGRLLLAAAISLAEGLGIGEAAIGLTVVAVGTSLPELVTSTMASFRGNGDIAVGNVIGSNMFNILGILGVTAVVHPLARGAIGWADIATMVALACVVTVMLTTHLRIGRVEGALLVASYCAYTGWVLAT